MTVAAHVFALHAPNPACFSGMVAGGQVELGVADRYLARARRDAAVALTDATASRLWSAAAGSSDVATFVARWSTDPVLLARILSRSARSNKVRRAVLDNPSTPLDALIGLARSADGAPLGEHAVGVLQARLEQLTFADAVEVLPDGLPIKVYATVAQRIGITFADAERHLDVAWQHQAGSVGLVPVHLADLLSSNLPVAVDWSSSQLNRLVASCPNPCVAAANLVGRNPQLMDDGLLSLRFVALATGPASETIRIGAPDSSRADLAVTLAGSPCTSREHLFRLIDADARATSGAAVLVAGHPHADPVWFDSCRLSSPAGMIAGARQLATLAEFQTPGMWAAAGALAGSWSGNVHDFVVAARTLLAGQIGDMGAAGPDETGD